MIPIELDLSDNADELMRKHRLVRKSCVDLIGCRTAIFSANGLYRYVLSIHFTKEGGVATYILLNPSTATEQQNDPTVERLERRSQRMGFGALVVLNLFAYRATDPLTMRESDEPVGPLNNTFIKAVVKNSSLIVCGWGQHGKHMGRDQTVLELLKDRTLHVFKLSQDGTPVHPLYLPHSLEPTLWRQGNAEEVRGQ